MSTISPIQTKSDLETILEQLSIEQIRFVISRVESATDKEAAQKTGLNYNGVRQWTREVKELVDQATRLMVNDGIVTALHLRRRSLARAMEIKVGGLDSVDEKLCQSVATEVIEWELGKASQKIDLSGEIDVNYRNELERRLSRLVEPGPATGVPEQSE